MLEDKDRDAAAPGSGVSTPKSRTNRPFTLRLSPAERAGLDRTAAERGVAPGRYVRRLIREAVGTDADLFDDERAELRRLRSSVNAVGRNLNQIAVRLNRAADGEAALGEGDGAVIREVSAQVALVSKALKDMDRTFRSRRIRLRRAAGQGRAAAARGPEA